MHLEIDSKSHDDPRLMLNNLDVLRALGVACVLVAHVIKVGLKLSDDPVIDELGHFGVLVFFVHTSTVLLMSLSRTPESKRWGPFYVRRAFRIYPLAAATIALVMAVNMFLLDGRWAFSGMDLVSNFLLIQNITGAANVIGPMWSLPFEVQMYLVLPYLYSIMIKGRAITSVAAMWCFVATLNVFSGIETILRYVPCFLAGAFAYELLKRRRAFIPGVLWPAALALALSIPVFLSSIPTTYRERLLRDYLVSLVVGILIGVSKEMPANALVSGCATVAKYSYGLYLLHMPILWFSFRYLSAPVSVQFCIFTALCLAMPWAAYRWIEQPLMDLGRSLAAGSPATRRAFTSEAAA